MKENFVPNSMGCFFFNVKERLTKDVLLNGIIEILVYPMLPNPTFCCALSLQKKQKSHQTCLQKKEKSHQSLNKSLTKVSHKPFPMILFSNWEWNSVSPIQEECSKHIFPTQTKEEIISFLKSFFLNSNTKLQSKHSKRVWKRNKGTLTFAKKKNTCVGS